MPDLIRLLPDAVANQIAAGEVIQRPASVVKELLENAVDAGSTDIRLIVKDAGKTLIRVVDNGCGMSETDARMCLERHATSKITSALDLFAIRTMGFRGEAMASIAAVAHLEIKTRRTEDELGTCLRIEGSELLSQEPCQTAQGTSMAVKNLFFNVPARRKFLKSDGVEMRHIVDEFQRVALSNPDLKLVLTHNDHDMFHLEPGSFRQRVVGIFGKNYNQKLVPVDEETNIVNIEGFIGKPECAKKTRGEQFFFVNNRYIKSTYLNHAVLSAYDELIPKSHHPSYFLRLETDPEKIDINIHPTKTEIKFEDERSIYAIIRSAVKQSLGKYNISPSLDFEQESSFEVPYSQMKSPVRQPTIQVDTSFNPFEEQAKKQVSNPSFNRPSMDRVKPEQWEPLFDGQTSFVKEMEEQQEEGQQQVIAAEWENEETSTTGKKLTYQLHRKYILTNIKSGFMVIHQQRAHERILFERYRAALEKGSHPSQQLLFPQTVEFPAPQALLLTELEAEIKALGFDVRPFGQHTFVIQGLPSEAADADARELLEEVLDRYQNSQIDLKLESRDNLAATMAYSTSVKPGRTLSSEEMAGIIDELFACEVPYSSPDGKSTLQTLTLEDLDKRFETL